MLLRPRKGDSRAWRLVTLVAALVLTAALATGCGGDETSGSEGTLTTSSLSKEDYVRQANTICKSKKKNYDDEITTVLKGLSAEGASEVAIALKAVKAVLLPINEAQVVALRKLGAPKGDEDKVEAALDAQQEAISEARAVDRVRSINKPVERFADAAKMLESYGLKECVYSP